MKHQFTYTTLRYVHDTTTGEFANVGVVLYSPQARFADARFTTKYGRLTQMFAGFDKDHFKSVLSALQSRFDQFCRDCDSRFEFEFTAKTALEFATSILPHDDNSMQWSPMGVGAAEDLPVQLSNIYERMVARYEKRTSDVRRTDDEVWSKFREELKQAEVLARLAPKKIVGLDDEYEFEKAWKNDQWHVIEAFSLDLADSQNIKDKAHKIYGQIASLSDSKEPFKVHLLLGEPQTDRLKDAFRRATNILRKLPVPSEIVSESDSKRFATELARQIKAHDEVSPTQDAP